MTLLLEAEITPGMTTAEAVRLATTIEDAGFDRLGISDVALYPDAFMVQTACALATSRIHIGAMVTNPYSRHPALLAAAVAALHDLSGGRAFLGIGAGAGLEPLSIPQPSPVRALREALDIIDALLRGDTVDHDGAVFQVRSAKLAMPPTTRIPISIGTRSRRVMELAGERADIALVGARYLSARLAGTYRGWLATGASRVGRDVGDIDIAPRMTLCVSEDGALATRSVKRYVGHYLNLVDPDDLVIDPERLAAIRDAMSRARGWYFDHDRHDPPELDDLVTDEMVQRFAIAGSPRDCIAHCERLRDLGFTSISMNLAAVRRGSMYDGLLETVRSFATVIDDVKRL
jgi:5,10-methylenetetrahydromethanopterin reductase